MSIQLSAMEPKQGVQLAVDISFDDLVRLLRMYSNRLREIISSGRSLVMDFVGSSQEKRVEVLANIRYLRLRLAELIDLGSISYERIITNPAQKYELDLVLFDAENTMRDADRLTGDNDSSKTPLVKKWRVY